jgi:hypothetical protein
MFPDLYPEQPPRTSQPFVKQVEPCLDISALRTNAAASARPVTPSSGNQRERQLSSFIAQPTIAPTQPLQVSAKPSLIPKVIFQSCMLNQDVQLNDDSNTEETNANKININEIRKEQQVGLCTYSSSQHNHHHTYIAFAV